MKFLQSQLLFIYTLLLGLLALQIPLQAQTRVQVVTKTIENQFAYKPGDKFQLEGEKANISIKGWNQSQVKIVLKLVSKAPSQETAKEELDYQRYIMEKRKDIIHVRNYFVLPKGKKSIQAILLAEYEIWIPNQAIVSVTNSYGAIQMDGISGQIDLTSRYGNIKLSNVQGKANFKSYFGDFIAKNINGQIQGTFDYTKTSIDGLGGEVELVNTLGDMSLSNLNLVKSLQIKATKSDVNLSVSPVSHYQYKFATEFGEINIPKNTGEQLVKNRSGLVTWQYKGVNLPLVSVSTTFGDITLQSP